MWGWHGKLNNHKNLPENLASFSESSIKRPFVGPMAVNWPTLHRQQGKKLLFCYSWAHSASSTLFYGAYEASSCAQKASQGNLFIPSVAAFFKAIASKVIAKILFDSCPSPTVSKEARKRCFRPRQGYLRKRSIKWNYINFQSLGWKQGNFGWGKRRRFNSADKQDFVNRAWGWDPTLCKRFDGKRRETVGEWKGTFFSSFRLSRIL